MKKHGITDDIPSIMSDDEKEVVLSEEAGQSDSSTLGERATSDDALKTHLKLLLVTCFFFFFFILYTNVNLFRLCCFLLANEYNMFLFDTWILAWFFVRLILMLMFLGYYTYLLAALASFNRLSFLP